MKRATSRRAFVKLAGSGAAAFSLSAIAGPAADRSVRPLNESPAPVVAGAAPRLSRKTIESEIRRRTQGYLAQDYLEVDYYRIGRRLAYPLPIRSLSIPSVPVPSIPVYPWATWMTWELEERVTCLGWAAEWFADADARRAAERDLAALTEWPEHRQYAMPDLSSAHAGRILWRAHTQWRWLDDSLRKKIAAGCQRHVENVLPESDRLHGEFLTQADLLQSKAPHGKIQNIPFIGTVGAALTASVARHADAPRLNQRLQALFGAILDLRSAGVVEGVSYDGYVLDFVSDWLGILPAGERDAFLNHPNFSGYLQESYMLAAPGTAEQVAELSDVEPREMPFHLSAQAKLQTHQPDPVRAWHLGRCRIDWLRADALAALHRTADDLAGQAPSAGLLNAHYALVLRSGWEAGDLAVAVSNTRSPMGHIQNDNGSLTLGTRGLWLVTDPGYQQYVKGEERDFTLGPAAHNAPVVNGAAQNSKQPVLVSADSNPNGVWRAVLELGKCYPAGAGVKSVLRTVWLAGKELVVVADRVEAKALQRVAYHWHGHPAAAWWALDGWIRLRLPGAGLWITSPQAKISAANIQRLPGSRGQLTLMSETEVTAPAMWWIFSLGEKPPSVALASAGLRLEVAGHTFNLREG